ncbi:MAG: hypothetical protein MZV70_42930 [Desulfobacterales bacterium]|nr:hypothetical protein [Desulfobacterales bacterium]
MAERIHGASTCPATLGRGCRRDPTGGSRIRGYDEPLRARLRRLVANSSRAAGPQLT